MNTNIQDVPQGAGLMNSHNFATGLSVGAIGSWFVTLMSSIDPVISGICGLVGIVSGIYAIRFHYTRIRAMKERA